MPKTPKEVLADPNFYQLPEPEQQKVLAKLDPHFATLPASERSKVLEMGKSRLSLSPSDTASLHEKAGFTTTQGAPQEEPGFLSRLAETTGVPTSLSALKPELATTGPWAAPVMAYRYLKNLVSGAAAPPTQQEQEQMQRSRIAGAANIGSKYILEKLLAPVGGAGVSRMAEDFGQGNIGAGLGDLAGTAINLRMLKGGKPEGSVEKLVTATDSMPKDVRTAFPEIKAEVSRSGRPSSAVDLGKRIDSAESRLNQEYAATAGPYAHATLGPTPQGTWPISDAIRSLITPNMDLTAQGRAAKNAIIARASEFEKPWKLGDLDQERIDANNRLNAYYKKGAVDQYAAEGQVGTAIDKIIADSIRDHVYPFLDAVTGKPKGYHATLKQRIGALMNMASDLKENAEKAEKQSMKASGGSSKLPKLRGIVGGHGVPRVYLSESVEGKDPFGVVNKAARKAFPGPTSRVLSSAKNAYAATYPAREEDARERAQRLVQLLAQGAQ